MKKKHGLVILIIFVLLFTFGCSKNSENIIKADNGEIDLSNLDFSKDKNITLSGSWKLYWNQLIDPAEVNKNDNFTYISLPNSWTEKNSEGEELKSDGYGTLVLNTKLNTNFKRYAIKTVYLTSAFKIYANGKLIAVNGDIGENAEAMVPQWKPIVGTFEVPSDGNVELVIQFSNFNHRRMVLKDIYIGTNTNIEQSKNLRTFFDIFAFGCIFTMGCYHLILYFFRRSDKSAFYFSFVCFIFAIRTILVGERVIYSFIPSLDWDIFMKMAYLTVYLNLPLIAKFIMEVLGEKRSDIFPRAIKYLSIVFSLIVIFTKPKQFDLTLIIYQLPGAAFMIYLIVVLIKAVRRKQQSAQILLIGYIVFLATVLNDLLYENNVIGTNSFSVFGIIFLILSQSFMLAYKFSRSFKRVKELSVENTKIKKTEKQLVEARDLAEESLVAKSEFIANMSHELRTPINVIFGAIQLFELYIKNGNFDKDKLITHLSSMKINCLRLLKLANNLIDTTKIDSGFYEPHFMTHDIVSMLEDITSSVQDYAKQKNIDLKLYSYIEKQPIVCDIDIIERIMLNLISNAIKFTNKYIYITLEKKDNNVIIRVKDDGIGIEEDKQKLIFERYKQASNLFTRNNEGSGIGLSLSKTLVEMHEGNISVKSDYGNGSEFIVELPITTQEDEDDKSDNNGYFSNNEKFIEKMKVEFSDIYK